MSVHHHSACGYFLYALPGTNTGYNAMNVKENVEDLASESDSLLVGIIDMTRKSTGVGHYGKYRYDSPNEQKENQHTPKPASGHS
jgi:hypothetical protein